MSNRKPQYLAEMWCPNCGTYQKVISTKTTMLIVPCHGCGGNNFCVEGSVIHLTTEELLSLAKGRELEACGAIHGVDYSERYSNMPVFSDDSLKQEISKLTGGDSVRGL